MSEDLKGRVRAARTRGGGAPPDGGSPAGDGGGGGEVTPVRALIGKLHRMKDQFAMALPAGIEPDQLVRDAITATRATEGLLECHPDSILGAVMTCAQTGLRPGVNGEAWILPFRSERTGRKEATYVAGYQGLVKLAHQSGLVRGVTARTVFERELPRFRLVWHHDRDELTHEPYLLGDPGPPRLYYARALLAGGGYQMTRPVNHEDMKVFRERRVKIKTGPWFEDTGRPGSPFEAMAWKTCFKSLAKWLPRSTQLQHALAADEGVRYDPNPKADPGTVTEHPAGGGPSIDGEWSDAPPPADPVEWGDATTRRPPTATPDDSTEGQP